MRCLQAVWIREERVEYRMKKKTHGDERVDGSGIVKDSYSLTCTVQHIHGRSRGIERKKGKCIFAFAIKRHAGGRNFYT